MAFDPMSFVIGQQAGKSGGSSGGGGSLPAGAYWKQIQPLVPVNKEHIFFVFNDVLYLCTKTSDGSGFAIYKFSDEKYTFVTQVTNTYLYPTIACELNGKVHLFVSNASYHYVFDGTTITKMSNLSGSPYSGDFFVFNGTIYASYLNDTYQWNESSDTWTVSDLFPSGYKAENKGIFLVHNNELYSIGDNITSKQICKYENQSMVKILDMPVYASGSTVSYEKGKVYYIHDVFSPTDIYCYDIESNTIQKVGSVPNPGGTPTRGYMYNGRYRLYGGSDEYRNHIELYEVTE